MSLNKKKEYLFNSVSTLQGVGPKLTKYLNVPTVPDTFKQANF